MIRNPELQRQVWLELTPHRVLALPLLLGLAFGLISLTLGGSAVARPAFWSFGGLLLLWGTRRAGDSIADEIRGRTWDAQRMSALPPSSLTFGKLAGGPIFIWYGALLCAAAYLITAREPWLERASNLLLLGTAGVLLHAVALLATLQAVRKQRAVRERGLGWLPLVALLALLPLLQVALGDAARETALPWWGLEIRLFDASLLSALAFAAWAVVGVQRLMRAELQMRSPPWAWLAFLGFAMAWAAGFVGPEQRLAEGRLFAWRLVVAYFVGLGGVYAAAFAEPKLPVVFRRLLEFRRTGQRERLLDELPLWLASLPFVALLALALLLQPGTPTGLSAEEKQVAAALFLLLLRDLGLLLGLNFARDARRADLAAFVYLLALYGLAPALARALGAAWLTSFLRPRADVEPWASLLPLALEAVAVWGWAVARWRRAAADWPAEPAPARRGD